jgi:protein SCO1/2
MRVRIAAILAGALLVGACGGDGTTRELVGYTREPAPLVGDLEVPDLSAGGAPFSLRADPGELLVIYFGYTNCPDFCPTTLSDVRLARRELDDPSSVDVAMITIDPGRDLPVLADYLGGFFPDDGHALGTDDDALLARVAAPFGMLYEVTTNEQGDIEVGHRTDLYGVDDEGRIAITWPFGTAKDDLAADFRQLLEADT